ncbi:hypothetical protein SISSUDRAFT_218760 [Sistotremastrum suecicum HHB10207 ss-3]|uniref:Uncharacterized protein n=1 Tax=Sistotremastrum suecicum HHB10207 ss-3 TaxID=1314776 RepID=A0A166A5T6_9AGAM|nr:hypothetical protein SISSUDRAFT_218760 [Sistotremastrum suecicum HHB10207 ss-3]
MNQSFGQLWHAFDSEDEGMMKIELTSTIGAGAGEACTRQATRVKVRTRAFDRDGSMTKVCTVLVLYSRPSVSNSSYIDPLHALPGEVHASKLYQEQNADNFGDRVNYTNFQACVKDHPTECSSMVYRVQDERHGIHGRFEDLGRSRFVG